MSRDLAADSGCASQPAGALQPLGALNKSSARLATFAVRLCGGRVVEYTYKNKKDNQEVKAQKFEVWLVGQNPEHYCIGYVKSSEDAPRQPKASQRPPKSICLEYLDLSSRMFGLFSLYQTPMNTGE